MQYWSQLRWFATDGFLSRPAELGSQAHGIPELGSHAHGIVGLPLPFLPPMGC